jgi:membrane protein implicated in regulation of membrane protease activity
MTILWLIVTVAAAVIEIATEQLVSVWFVVGGVVAFVLAWLGFPPIMQVVAFAALSAFGFALIRRYLAPYVKSQFTPTNVDRLIGTEAVVTKRIQARGRGEVKVNEQYWTARGEDPETPLEEDSVVVIRAIEGATMIVFPLEEA